MRTLTYSALALIAAVAPAAAQNDECTGAIALVAGVATPFDTTTATLSAPAWPCAASTAPDLWYSYTATGSGTVTFDTCGSSYDCAIEAFTGTCAALTSLLCLDDSCGLQVAITFPATAGTTYFVRVGGFSTSSGTGTITATEGAPPPPIGDECVQTIIPFLSNNGGNVGGAVYFDLSATQNVMFSGLTTNYSAAAGTPVGVMVYTTPGTHVGNEANMAAWTLVAMDDGTAVSAGLDMETDINFAMPFNLAAGSYGVALVAVGSAHRYTNGNGANQMAMSVDGVLSTTAGAASNVPFTAPTFTPRVWNGRLCHDVIGPGPNCVQTIDPFLSNNGGSVGGAVYFDLTASQNVSFSGLTTNYSAVAGTPVGVTVFTIPGTHVGNEGNMAAWTQVAIDDGTAVSAGTDMETNITFASPFALAAGTYGIALVASGSAHRYTNGTGGNQTAMSPDGVLSTSAGSASNVPFTLPIFTPRVWNGRLCHSAAGGPGTNYCGPGVPNSTGNPGVMDATGSASFAANDLVIIGTQLPVGAFAYFLASTTQGFVPMPGGSQGNLCLGGDIGRFVAAGQIKTVDANGQASLAIDWTAVATPSGLLPTTPGTNWNFQLWHRDMNPGVTSNFTDGRSITVTP